VPDGWRRYVAPAAFLLAATIAIVLIRAGLESGSDRRATSSVAVPASPRKHVAVTTTKAKQKKRTQATTAAAFWTVKAGDTFGVISSSSGVPVATIEKLNPNVSSTSLHLGQKVRIR
jgi:LysM repeat protein